jgi:tetratricopeptide (TPR) repeat protein
MRDFPLGTVLLFLLVGCRRPGTTEPRPIASATLQARVAPLATSPIDDARRLAVAPTKEDAAVDRRLAALSQVALAKPRKTEAFLELGRAWVRKARETSDPGYYLNASACADVVLDHSPHDNSALELRSLVLLNEHKFREARDVASSILAVEADRPLAWGTLSDALLELGDLEQADRAAQRMMELKPNLPSYSRVSYFQWLAGDTGGALESARLAIDAAGDPQNPEGRAWAVVQTAMLFWHRGDYAGADAGFQQALEVITDYPPALVGRGRVAMAEGDAKRAVGLYERAFRKSPLVETAWLLGEAREFAGDEPGAQQAFARAANEGRTSDPRTLSLMYSTRNVEPVEALRLAEQERTRRGDIYTEDALAWALYRNGRFDEAKVAIDRARRYGTKDARLLYHEGAIAMAVGRKKEGESLVSTSLQLNARFDVTAAAEARKLLERK